MTEWVKVTDRMPKSLMDVLFIVKDGFQLIYRIGFYDKLNNEWVDHALMDIIESEKEEANLIFDKNDVIYWMKIPKLPRIK